jgi:hypothetical protein
LRISPWEVLFPFLFCSSFLYALSLPLAPFLISTAAASFYLASSLSPPVFPFLSSPCRSRSWAARASVSGGPARQLRARLKRAGAARELAARGLAGAGWRRAAWPEQAADSILLFYLISAAYSRCIEDAHTILRFLLSADLSRF